MKLLLALLFVVTFAGTTLCGTIQSAANKNVRIKSIQLTKSNHHGGGGRGRGPCTGTAAPGNPGVTTPFTARPSIITSLLPLPPFTAPVGQTPFPNIDVRDTELVA